MRSYLTSFWSAPEPARRRVAEHGFTIVEALLAMALVFAAITGGLALLDGIDRAGRSLGARDRAYREASRIASRLRTDLSRAEATSFLETSATPLVDPLPPENDPTTLPPIDERDRAGSPFDAVLDRVACVKRSGEGDSIYFRTHASDGDRSLPVNVLWRVAFRDENRNGRADVGERRLERIVIALGPGGLDASRLRVQTLTTRLVHFRLSYLDAREHRFLDPSSTLRRFGYPHDGTSLGALGEDGILTCDAVTDGFADLRRGDLVHLEPPGLEPGTFPIIDSRAGRLLFRLPGRPTASPTPFRAAYLPIAVRATFAIEADSVERDQLVWPTPAEIVGRADRRAIVRTFSMTVTLRGTL